MTNNEQTGSIEKQGAQHFHNKASEHAQAASIAHKEAADCYGSGDLEQAATCAARAHGHTLHANEHSEKACKEAADAEGLEGLDSES